MSSRSLSVSDGQVRWWLLAALLPFAAVSIAHWGQAPSATDGDYAQYLLHAKAIVDGRPYSDIGYIYTDLNLVGPRNQPPGWPLVLAPFVAVFGLHSSVFIALVRVLTAAFGFLAGAYFARKGELVGGLVVAAAVPLALETQFGTGSALSDPLFCLLVWATLWVADAPGDVGWRRAALIAALSVAAISVRVAGIAIIPGLILYVVMRRRAGSWRVFVPAALMLGLGLVVVVAVMDSVPFLDRAGRGFEGLSHHVRGLAMTYREALSVGALYPLRTPGANDVYHLLVAVPLLIGGVAFLFTQAGTAVWCFSLAYLAVLAVSPVRESRYAWPLTPLVMFSAVTGLHFILARAPGILRAQAARIVAAFFAVVVIGAAVQLAMRPAPRSLDDPDTRELFNWVRSVKAADSAATRILFTNPRVLTLETGVSAMGIPYASDEKSLLTELRENRISHVVVPLQNLTRASERNLIRFVAAHPELFPVIFRNDSHDVRRFVKDGLPIDTMATRTPPKP